MEETPKYKAFWHFTQMTHFRCPVSTPQLALLTARLSFPSQQKDMIFNHALTLTFVNYEEKSEPNMMIKTIHVRARLPRFKSWHCHLQALVTSHAGHSLHNHTESTFHSSCYMGLFTNPPYKIVTPLRLETIFF